MKAFGDIARREKSLKERLQAVAHLMAGNFLGSIIGLAGFALTARALGPTDYGILALCFAFIRAVERLVSFQSWQPLIKFGSEAKEAGRNDDLRVILKFGLLLDVAAAIAGCLIAILLVLLAAPFFGLSEPVKGLVLVYCFVLPFQLSGMPTAVLRLFGRFTSLAYGQVISSLLRVILCFLGYITGAGLFEFALIWMAAQILSAISLVAFSLVALKREGLLHGLASASMAQLRTRFPGLWKFAISANVSLTIRASANELDTLLVGYLADPASAGLFHIAKRVGRLAQQAGSQVQTVLYPELARAWASGASAEFRRAVSQTQWLLLAFGVAMIGAFYVSIEPLLKWTAGPQFVGAAPLVIVQSIAVTLTLVGAVFRSALLAIGEEHRVLTSVLISVVGFYVTALIFIPQIGAMGANVAHIVMAVLWLAMMYVAYRRRV
ncbi:oligosaccharide flippase family protein [Ensifer sp. ENS11]|nr:oligosaccharide flippase family protein [Ensifer sp. ENS11]MBD9490059.1 oligosaccharide flippase family protein [Ensifer sp. ENS11]